MTKSPISRGGKPFDILWISRDIREEFLREAVRKNHLALLIISLIIWGVELYNIARVLFWSKSGLQTLNNRIYFGMYLSLIVIAALWAAAGPLLRRADAKVQWAWQYAAILLIFLWHVTLNTYDLYQNPAAGVTVFTTAILGLAILIQMPPVYSLIGFGLGYGVFQFAAARFLSDGERINLTITFVVALAVSQVNAYHAVVSLRQQRQITQINGQLKELLQLDPLTGLLNKTAIACRAEQCLTNVEKTGGVTLIIIDLDDFKYINDHYGHPCGDHVLTKMAESMRLVFPKTAELGRIGGDEFAVFIDRPLTEEEACALESKLLEKLRGIRWQGEAMPARCSLGVCICTCQRTYAQLYAQADRLLYEAKKEGKSRGCIGKIDSTEKPDGSVADGTYCRKEEML